MIILVFAFMGSSTNYVKAQMTPYQVGGCIRTTDTVWHFIYGVNVGDLVIISITPSSGSPYYWSAVYYPNMTLLQSVGNWDGYPSDTYGYPGTVGFGRYSVAGSQSYQFIATQTGNYLLKFSTSTANTFNYTIKSSHRLSNGTPLGINP